MPIASEPQQRCGRCGQIKPIELFPISMRYESGRENICITCKAQTNKGFAKALALGDAKRAAQARTRKCYICGEIKPVEAFPRIAKRAVLNLSCKACLDAEWIAHDEKTQNYYHSKSQSIRDYRKENYDNILAYQHNLRAQKLGVEGTFTGEELTALRHAQGHRCAYCKQKTTLTVDHIIPMSKGGLNYIWNIAWACWNCNMEKGRKTLDEWVNRWYEREHPESDQ